MGKINSLQFCSIFIMIIAGPLLKATNVHDYLLDGAKTYLVISMIY